jgi:hypothetical protein
VPATATKVSVTATPRSLAPRLPRSHVLACPLAARQLHSTALTNPVGQGGADIPVRTSKGWQDWEYAALFAAHPPDGPRPDATDIRRIAAHLQRGTGGVYAQWEDAQAVVHGSTRTRPSPTLLAFLVATALLDPEAAAAARPHSRAASVNAAAERQSRR